MSKEFRNAALLLVSSAFFGFSHADVLDLPTEAPAAVAAKDSVPVRGMSKAAVQSRFGKPMSREAAVGKPPISIWHYPGFDVYFEHDLTLHSVVKGAPPKLYKQP